MLEKVLKQSQNACLHRKYVLEYPRKDIRMRSQIIIHIDMDAFFAAVEIRDNTELLGKPVIIGSMPNERGVVCTCNY